MEADDVQLRVLRHEVYNGRRYTSTRWTTIAEDTRTIKVTFPKQLLEELDSVVPTGKRSEVIVAATAAYLRRINVLAALRETQGAWRDEDHPALITPEDVNRRLPSRRSSWRRVPLRSEGEPRV
jgi:Arc/MetJ-type ribon-helix-helix transcriptional regulator